MHPSGCLAPPPKVLIVDDEPSIARSTALLLEDLGYRVATCGDATAIRDCIEREAPDILLQDLRMPGLDLERLVFELRASPRWRTLPIVIFTASMDVDEVVGRIGAAGLVEKPFTPQEIRQVLAAALPGR